MAVPSESGRRPSWSNAFVEREVKRIVMLTLPTRLKAGLAVKAVSFGVVFLIPRLLVERVKCPGVDHAEDQGICVPTMVDELPRVRGIDHAD